VNKRQEAYDVDMVNDCEKHEKSEKSGYRPLALSFRWHCENLQGVLDKFQIRLRYIMALVEQFLKLSFSSNSK